MSIGNGILGRLLGAKYGGGEANPAAGAEVSEYDKKGNPIKWFKKDEDGNALDVTDDAKKYGTGALKRPSFGMAMFAPDQAAHVNAINTGYQALPAEDQEKYQLERKHLEDVIDKGYSGVTGQKLDPTQKEQWAAAIGTRAIASGFSAGDIAAQLEKATELKEGGPQATGELAATRTKSGLAQEQAFRAAQGPELLGSAQAKQAGVAGQLASGELSRMPITQQVLNSDMVNRLVESTGLTPKRVQYEAQNLKYQLGRLPTENEVETQALKNRLWQEQNITPLQLGTEAGRAQTASELLPTTQQTMRNTAASQMFASAQPPDINRLSLYRPNMNAIQGGDLRHAYARIGMNPYIQTPMMTQMETAKRLGGQQSGSGGFMKLPSGAIIGPPMQSATPPSTPAPMNIPTVSVGGNPSAQIAPQVQRPSMVSTGYDLGSTAGAPNNAGMWNDYLQRLKWAFTGGWGQQRQDAINP